MAIQPGDIYFADLNPPSRQFTREMSKERPVVIASIAELNEASEVVIILPISRSMLIPDDANAVYLKKDSRNNLDYDSAVYPLHIRGISKARLKRRIGRLSPEQLDSALLILMDALGIVMQ